MNGRFKRATPTRDTVVVALIALFVLASCTTTRLATRVDLESAALSGDVSLITQYLRKGGNPDVVVNSLGWTMLHTAGIFGQTPVVKALLHAGADRHKEDHSGRTALEHAIREEHERVCRLLAKNDVVESPEEARASALEAIFRDVLRWEPGLLERGYYRGVDKSKVRYFLGIDGEDAQKGLLSRLSDLGLRLLPLSRMAGDDSAAVKLEVHVVEWVSDDEVRVERTCERPSQGTSLRVGAMRRCYGYWFWFPDPKFPPIMDP